MSNSPLYAVIEKEQRMILYDRILMHGIRWYMMFIIYDDGGVVMYMEGWARAQRCCIVTAATLG